MYFTGSWMGGSIVTDAEKPDNFAVAPIPVVNSENASVTDFMGGGSDTLMVSAGTKNKLIRAVPRQQHCCSPGAARHYNDSFKGGFHGQSKKKQNSNLRFFFPSALLF